MRWKRFCDKYGRLSRAQIELTYCNGFARFWLWQSCFTTFFTPGGLFTRYCRTCLGVVFASLDLPESCIVKEVLKAKKHVSCVKIMMQLQAELKRHKDIQWRKNLFIRVRNLLPVSFQPRRDIRHHQLVLPASKTSTPWSESYLSSKLDSFCCKSCF